MTIHFLEVFCLGMKRCSKKGLKLDFYLEAKDTNLFIVYT